MVVIFAQLCWMVYLELFVIALFLQYLLQLSIGECNRCMALQCCKIKWNEENLGLCFQVKLNCSKVDKINCKAFLSCTIELMQLFYHLEALATILKLKGPFSFSFSFLFYFILFWLHISPPIVWLIGKLWKFSFLVFVFCSEFVLELGLKQQN